LKPIILGVTPERYFTGLILISFGQNPKFCYLDPETLPASRAGSSG
jgi:hypothetical protein